MRQIKFRALYRGIWVYMDLLQGFTPEGYEIYKELLDLGTPLLQFTGLLDKNGKEIYEGDIVKGNFDNQMGSYTPSMAKVFFNEPKAEFVCERPDNDDICWSIATDTEVIGNIYENPELLK